jgi:NADPH-dependent 2,4-dienoyl-CoA reductase/sulfur reductase-like enzyme
MRTVIVGGVAGGMSAATRLRRLDERHEIVVFERSRHVSYANCGLPYHLGGVIEERASLILNTPHRFAERFAIDVRTGTEVVSIDRARQVVTAEELATGRRYETPWDHLVLSPGAAPIVPDVPGVERAHTLRTVEDMDKIVSAVREREAASAVVVGAGFIGLEAAENLSRAGLGVNVVELALQVLAPLDPELAQLVAEELTKQGVGLSLGSALAKVLPDSVELTDGRVLPGDLVVLAMGVRPETALALSAGLEVGTRGGIRVDERLRTSDPRIYAVGDAVEKTDQLSGEAVLVPLANIANRQGRIVADDIAGTPRPFQHVQGSAIIKVFREVAAVTGWNEKRLKDAGRRLLSRRRDDGPKTFGGPWRGHDPWSRSRRQGRSGQTHGRAGDCRARRDGSTRTDRPRALLRPPVRFGQGPRQHPRLCSREPPERQRARCPMARTCKPRGERGHSCRRARSRRACTGPHTGIGELPLRRPASAPGGACRARSIGHGGDRLLPVGPEGPHCLAAP